MSLLFYMFIYTIIFTLCNANDNCRLPTDPIDAFRYAVMIQEESSTLSIFDDIDKFEGWWSMVVEDSFDSIYIDGVRIKNNDDIIYNLHGIFVSPLGVLLYGRGGTTEQKVAPLCSALVDAGYRRPYLNACNEHVVGPAPTPVLRDVIPDQFAGRFKMPRTTPGTHISLTNSNNTDVLHGVMYGGLLLGIILLFVQIIIYYRKSSGEQPIKPVLVKPTCLPLSLDLQIGIHPQCRGLQFLDAKKSTPGGTRTRDPPMATRAGRGQFYLVDLTTAEANYNLPC